MTQPPPQVPARTDWGRAVTRGALIGLGLGVTGAGIALVSAHSDVATGIWVLSFLATLTLWPIAVLSRLLLEPIWWAAEWNIPPERRKPKPDALFFFVRGLIAAAAAVTVLYVVMSAVYLPVAGTVYPMDY